jgi:subtilisin family serine protease
MIGRRVRFAVLAAVSGLIVAAVGVPSFAADWSSKVAPRVLQETSRGATASFLVVMRSQADVSAADSLGTKLAKGQFVYRTLRTNADRTQAPVRALLDARGVAYETHFLVNLIAVTRGDRSLVQTLAARSDVASIDVNDWVKSSILPTKPAILTPRGPNGVEWNVTKVKAPQVWANGFTGQGIVVGDIDVGFQWDHPALKKHYRGWNGSTANHNYNWYDETDPANRAPIDPNGHGTHTVGTIIGDDGGTNQIGVAPGAKWIGCRAMDTSGLGNPGTYIGCFEFMIAPWDLNKQNPDPAKAPVAVSNSWYCSISLGECPNNQIMLTAVQNVRAAGIVPVVAAGNSGPTCQTIGNDGPPAQYDESYTVGAVTSANTLAAFSSRGPVSFQGTRIKPDIVAPGQTVRSSYPPNSYATLNGTSMATPHIAGVIALIYSAKPGLIGNVAATENLINHTAHHINSSECSSSGTFPNNLYGWGFVDAAKASKP